MHNLIEQLTPQAQQNTKKVARLSLYLLFFVITFHVTWLFVKNVIVQKTLTISGDDAGLLVALILLNFLSYAVALFLYKKEKYKKQLIVSTIVFIVSQYVLHVILSVTLRIVC